MMGITSHRLFPDLGGAAQSAVMSTRLFAPSENGPASDGWARGQMGATRR